MDIRIKRAQNPLAHSLAVGEYLRTDALRGLIGNAVGGLKASDPRLSLQL